MKNVFNLFSTFQDGLLHIHMATFAIDHIDDALQMIKDNCKLTPEEGGAFRIPSCGVGCSKVAVRAMEKFNFR